ncbi:hypothetical protein diail_12092 [Diaporthe ilicicola]|nr:hypothetical protein diail_12092 [Diaporthe ilicicola]
MAGTFNQCVSKSDLIVSENISDLSIRPPLRALASIASIASNTTCDTILFPDSHQTLVVPYDPERVDRLLLLLAFFLLLACVAPAWHLGWAEQNRPGNGPGKSASGGCNPGKDVFGALDSLEKGHSPLTPSGSKRKRGHGRSQPSRAGSRKIAQQPSGRRNFACHFYLHDRIGHRECLIKKLPRVSDVRQHLLERTHKHLVHCPVCGVIFTERRPAQARQQRDAHVQAATCEPLSSPPNYPGLTEDEEQRIRQDALDGRTTQYDEVHRWYMIWEVLFPGEAPPDSPFLEDSPEIQHMVDQRDVVFGSDLWMSILPDEPWVTAMHPEQRRTFMYNIVESFIRQARGVVERNEISVGDDQGTEGFSHIGVETPDPSGTPMNLGVISLPSFTSNHPLDPPRQTHAHPLSAAQPGQAPGSHTLVQVEPNPRLPAVVLSSPSHLDVDPAVDVSQNTHQPGPGTDRNDPTFAFLDLQQLAANDDFAMGLSPRNWQNSIYDDDFARSEDG